MLFCGAAGSARWQAEKETMSGDCAVLQLLPELVELALGFLLTSQAKPKVRIWFFILKERSQANLDG